ncbi:MAG TPA: DUF2066 domain-containing protein [Rhizomicrobium sp.]|nr:DUF2066 domain-containing protein [Rhizomicrobium sp.]
MVRRKAASKQAIVALSPQASRHYIAAFTRDYMRRFLAILGVGFVLTAPAALAADNIFVVKGVHVDATAPSSSQAQILAINQGKPKAWTQLYHKLTRQADWGKQPKLDDATLSRILRGYAVANEKRSTTRYVADITYVFNPDAVQALLKNANVAYVEAAGPKTVMVVPLSPGYDPNSPWTQVWKGLQSANTIVPIVLPSMNDRGLLSSVSIAGVKWADIQAAAARVSATEAVIAQETTSGNRIVVQMRRVGPGPQYGTTVSVSIAPGQPMADALGSAASAANQVIVDNWKNHAAINYNAQNILTAEVHISSLDDWAGVQNRIATISSITGLTVVAMNIGEARVNLAYVGTLDQLKDSLKQQNLSLSSQQDGIWNLAKGAGDADGDAQ